MSPLLTDLARHSGQLSLSVIFMLLLTLVLYGETHIATTLSGLLAGIWPS